MSARPRFAVVASHPIQYYAPFYRALAAADRLDVHAIFASRIGLDKTFDPGMGVPITWKTDLLAGYSHEFLPEAPTIKTATFWSINNSSISTVLDRHRPDAVLIHGYTMVTMLRALAWCRRRGVPALMISDSSLHSETRPLARIGKRALLPLIFSQFSAFLSIGDANERYFDAFGVPAERIFRVPNVIDEGFWQKRAVHGEERLRWRAKLGLTDADLAVLFVGKLMSRKRPADLFAALELLAKSPSKGRRVRLIVAGDGEQRAELQARAKGLPVDMLGFINMDELPGIYAAADVLAHPAEKETFGVIAIEAAILGLPLVLSDRVGAIGPTSIARPGENTLVYACGDVAELAAILRRLADEPETLARMSAASLAISKELDARKSVAGTEAAVAYVMGRHKAHRAPRSSKFETTKI